MIPKELSPNNILKVYDLIKPYIKKTPLIKASNFFDNLFNTKLFFKCEFLQNSGSFKSRGAINNILSNQDDKLKIVILGVKNLLSNEINLKDISIKLNFCVLQKGNWSKGGLTE